MPSAVSEYCQSLNGKYPTENNRATSRETSTVLLVVKVGLDDI